MPGKRKGRKHESGASRDVGTIGSKCLCAYVCVRESGRILSNGLVLSWRPASAKSARWASRLETQGRTHYSSSPKGELPQGVSTVSQ